MAETQRQIAVALKVSQVTVSRALRGEAGVSERLRLRILKEAKRTGYSLEASFAARHMRHQGLGRTVQTNVICAILPGDLDDHSFTGRMLRGISAEGPRQGSEVVYITQAIDDLPRVVQRRQVDGVIRILGDIQVLQGHTDCPVPWVSVLFDVPGADLVTIDQAAGCRELGQHLGRLGHRRVAFIGPQSDLSSERLAGARAGLKAAGGKMPPELILIAPYAANEIDTRNFVDRLVAMRAQHPFTAVVAYNDWMAVHAVQRLRHHGLRVPEDISVTGFDGALPAAFQLVRMTTAAIPLEDLGIEAVRTLCWRLANPDAGRRRVMLQTTMIQGDTTAPASR